MKTSIFILMTFFVTSIVGQSNENFLRNTIKTDAEVDTFVTPDEIFLQIITKEVDSKKELQELESKIIEELEKIGIQTDNNLKINDFGSYYNSKLIFGKNIKEVRSYQLKANSVKKAISAIVVLNELEIGQISLIGTNYSKTEELLLDLRTKAMIKAQSQAKSLIKPLNQNMGDVISIIDLGENALNSTHSGGQLNERVTKFKQELISTDLNLEKIRISKKIVVVFELN